jgi:branched-chain amino acid transport system ATP-binding protein
VSAVLEARELSVGYGKLTVARGINLRIEAGRVTCILGPNGAGKTTLLLTLAGFLAPLAGTIAVAGDRVTRGSARRMNRLGVVLVPDNRALFTQLNPIENLRLASRAGGPSVDEAMDLFPALSRRAKVRAGMLSGGEQQMLAVARSLVQGPKVLLIDEMSMGLAPVIVEQLVPIVRAVADGTGAAVVLVEQHVRLALGVADQAIVLVHGDIVLDDSAETLRADPAMLERAYFGDSGSADGAGSPPDPLVDTA